MAWPPPEAESGRWGAPSCSGPLSSGRRASYPGGRCLRPLAPPTPFGHPRAPLLPLRDLGLERGPESSLGMSGGVKGKSWGLPPEDVLLLSTKRLLLLTLQKAVLHNPKRLHTGLDYLLVEGRLGGPAFLLNLPSQVAVNIGAVCRGEEVCGCLNRSGKDSAFVPEPAQPLAKPLFVGGADLTRPAPLHHDKAGPRSSTRPATIWQAG